MGRLFGTDGVRGIANTALSCERAMEIGRAAAAVLAEGLDHKPLFIIGSDTRASSDMLGCAIAAGICSVGADVINVGVVPTPAVAYLVRKHKADAGVMISASHNSAEFNGIKIFSSDGFKLPDALEERVEAIVLDHASEPPRPIGGCVGRIQISNNAPREYIDFIKGTIDGDLSGLNVAIDCANGSASVSAEALFTELGANIHLLYASPDGSNINEKCGSTHIESLAKYVVENGLDCGVAFDGDADRCLMVDERGELIDGDQIMAICALDMRERSKLNKNTVVGTIMTNFGFTKFCEANKLGFIATKVGDRFVLEEMLLEDYSFGGEQSGHIIFRDYATTGDGQLTAVQVLSLIKRSGRKLSELASVMTRYPQTIVNLKVSDNGKLLFYTDVAVKRAIEKAKAELGDTGRIVVRPSGTEPLLRVMVEGMDENLIRKVANDVSYVISSELGSK